MEEEEEVQ
jgi:hypothetical protein